MSQPYEIIAGPLTLWLAPVATAFPIVTAAPAGPWAKAGASGDRNYSDDGVTLTHTQKIETARPAGATGAVKAWRTEEDLMIGITLWDATLEQYTNALSGVTPTTTAAATGVPGTKRIGLSRGQSVSLFALMARGPSAYGDAFVAQYEVPIVYQSANPKLLWNKGKPVGIELEFTALENGAAATEAERFGRLVMQHAAEL